MGEVGDVVKEYDVVAGEKAGSERTIDFKRKGKALHFVQAPRTYHNDPRVKLCSICVLVSAHFSVGGKG